MPNIASMMEEITERHFFYSHHSKALMAVIPSSTAADREVWMIEVVRLLGRFTGL